MPLENSGRNWNVETRLRAIEEMLSNLKCVKVYLETQKKLFTSADLDWMVLEKNCTQGRASVTTVKSKNHEINKNEATSRSFPNSNINTKIELNESGKFQHIAL